MRISVGTNFFRATGGTITGNLVVTGTSDFKGAVTSETSIDATGDTSQHGNVILDNTKALQGKESGGTARNLLTMSAINQENLGDANNLLTVNAATSMNVAATVKLGSGHSLQIDRGDGVYRKIGSIDGTHVIHLGDTAQQGELDSLGDGYYLNAAHLLIPHVETKVTAGSAASESVTWTTAFAATPNAVADAIQTGTPIGVGATVVSQSATGATVISWHWNSGTSVMEDVSLAKTVIASVSN